MILDHKKMNPREKNRRERHRKRFCYVFFKHAGGGPRTREILGPAPLRQPLPSVHCRPHCPLPKRGLGYRPPDSHLEEINLRAMVIHMEDGEVMNNFRAAAEEVVLREMIDAVPQ